MARALPNRRRVLLGAGLYALVLIGSPALHHDFVCHLKSSAHCTACTSTPVASSEVHAVRPDDWSFPDAGQARVLEAPSVQVVTLLPTTGRSPPRSLLPA
jgi:hypothetical protein